MESPPNVGHPRVAVTASLLLLLASVPVLLLSSSETLFEPLTFVLAAGAIVSVLYASDWEGIVDVSAAFVCFMLAAAFVGPIVAFSIAVIAEAITWTVRRYRIVALPVNLAATAVPSLVAALAFQELAGGLQEGSLRDIALLAAVAIGFLVFNYALLSALATLLDGGRLRDALRPPRALLPSLAITVALTVSIAAVFAQIGLAAGIFLVLVIGAFSYMSRLVVIARERTAQYAALSWGMLSS
ncbi:MAG: hypothetical protein M3376_02800, partial [Actinomycetota bacterium]|nr:hypothetical protein [Actinomycetota bacterium]